MAQFDIATYDCDIGYQSEGEDRVCEENGFSEIGYGEELHPSACMWYVLVCWTMVACPTLVHR